MITSAIYLIKIIFDTNEENNNSTDRLAMDTQSIAGGSPEQPSATSKNSTLPVKSQKTTNNYGNDELLTTSKQLFDDFDQRDVKLGGTGLHWCKSRKSLDKLIKLGIPLNSVNERRETALHVSIRRKKLSILIGLLCYGADVNCKNDIGETPLILACKLNDIFACQLLLVFDADVNLIDNKGYTARHYASNISNRFRKLKTNPLPVVSDIILAMLHAIGAKRCNTNTTNPSVAIDHQSESEAKINHKDETNNDNSVCSDGCSFNGSFDGNSYNRWPNFGLESFNKRHMFEYIIEDRLKAIKDKKTTVNSNQKKSRILCIDGGGMRGVIVCQTMIELEKYLKKPLIEYFDWIGGTSVGSFICGALCTGKTLQELRRISFDVKDEIFSGNKPYNSSFLERVLKRTLGSTTRMFDIKNKKLAITTVIADREPCQLMFFRNYKSSKDLLESHGFSSNKYNLMSGHSYIDDHYLLQQSTNLQNLCTNKSIASSIKTTKESLTSTIKSQHNGIQKPESPNNAATFNLEQLTEENPLLWQAVRASAAAPFFFKPYGPYLDGGIISNNPTLDMLTEFFNNESVKEFLRNRLSDNRIVLDNEDLSNQFEQTSKLNLLLSFGTGRAKVVSKQAMADCSSLSASFATVFSPVELVRSIRAVRDLFKKLMQQSCHTEDHVLDRAQAWCSSLGVPYFRINPPLTNICPIDDKRDEQIISALWQTKLYMRSMNKQIIQLAKILDEDIYL